jgi:hypothetical protein
MNIMIPNKETWLEYKSVLKYDYIAVSCHLLLSSSSVPLGCVRNIYAVTLIYSNSYNLVEEMDKVTEYVKCIIRNHTNFSTGVSNFAT